MPGLRLHLARHYAIVGLAFGLTPAALAQPVGRHRMGHARFTGTTAVTLRMLAVRTIGADKPWNPGVCIGCESHNAPLSTRLPLGHLR